VIERLKKVLKHSGDDLEKRAIVVAEKSRDRTGRLPIGTKGAE
jgi:hypothetical protein